MIESRSHVGVYHYIRSFSIENVSDFANAMNVEMFHTTHMLYVVLHGNGIVVSDYCVSAAAESTIRLGVTRAEDGAG